MIIDSISSIDAIIIGLSIYFFRKLVMIAPNIPMRAIIIPISVILFQFIALHVEGDVNASTPTSAIDISSRTNSIIYYVLNCPNRDNE